MPAGPAAKGSAIACRGLSKSFGKIEALHDLTLTVPSGVTFGLLGPNGAGKTTSLRLWLGLTAPTAGKAKVLGESIPPRAVLPRIGYMPQDLAIYIDLTVEENLACFGRLVGMDEDAIDRRTSEVLKLVDIAERRGGLAPPPSRGGGRPRRPRHERPRPPDPRDRSQVAGAVPPRPADPGLRHRDAPPHGPGVRVHLRRGGSQRPHALRERRRRPPRAPPSGSRPIEHHGGHAHARGRH